MTTTYTLHASPKTTQQLGLANIEISSPTPNHNNPVDQKPYIKISAENPKFFYQYSTQISSKTHQQYSTTENNTTYYRIFTGNHKTLHALQFIIRLIQDNPKTQIFKNNNNDDILEILENLNTILQNTLSQTTIPPAGKKLSDLSKIKNPTKTSSRTIEIYQENNTNRTYIRKTSPSSFTKHSEIEAANLTLARLIAGHHAVPETSTAWLDDGSRAGTLSQKIANLTPLSDIHNKSENELRTQLIALRLTESFYATAIAMYAIEEVDGNLHNRAIGQISPESPTQCLIFDGDQSGVRQTAKYSHGITDNELLNLELNNNQSYSMKPADIFKPTPEEITSLPALSSSNPALWLDNRNDCPFYQIPINPNHMGTEFTADNKTRANQWKYHYLLKTIALETSLCNIAKAQIQSKPGQDRWTSQRAEYLKQIKYAALQTPQFLEHLETFHTQYQQDIIKEIIEYNNNTTCKALHLKTDKIETALQQIILTAKNIKTSLDELITLEKECNNIVNLDDITKIRNKLEEFIENPTIKQQMSENSVLQKKYQTITTTLNTMHQLLEQQNMMCQPFFGHVFMRPYEPLQTPLVTSSH